MLVLIRDYRESQRKDFCLPRHHRLRTPRDFARVLEGRITGCSQYFRYSLVPNNLARPRLGVAVSRKVSGLSVHRNRIKRQLKEFFRHNQEETRGYDLVVMSIPGTGYLSNKEIRNDLKKLWEKLERHLSRY